MYRSRPIPGSSPTMTARNTTTTALPDNDPTSTATLTSQGLNLARSPLYNRANRVDANAKWDHKDSSEGQPSSHDSICDAAWLSTSDVAKSPYQTPSPSQQPVTPSPLRPGARSSNSSIGFDLDSESPLSRLETPFLYGHGTELAPIIEQRSIATLRTKGSLSTSDLSSLMHDAPGKSIEAVTGGWGVHQLPLRRHSPFSIDDDFSDLLSCSSTLLNPGEKKRQASKSGSGSSSEVDSSAPQLRRLVYSRPEVRMVDVRAYPRNPIYPPPQRPETPPSIRVARATPETRRPQSEGAVAYYTRRESSGTSTTPSLHDVSSFRFRPPRSGHGSLSTHPFLRRAIEANTFDIPGSASAEGASGSPRAGGRRTARRSYENMAEGAASGTKKKRVQSGQTATVNIRRLDSDLGLDSRGTNDHFHASSGVFEKTCQKCGRLRGERWSLISTLTGRGQGMRRGPKWCGRCACRKISRIWCCYRRE
ncbi:hypothetical protein GGS20DRAFT_362920 [Poronia punctata]|nr:hypothetical protein GGS20DRAFT_362920 [Poronia punctata]